MWQGRLKLRLWLVIGLATVVPQLPSYAGRASELDLVRRQAVRSEEPTSAVESSSLTLADLERIALGHNPTLRQAAESVEAARGVRLQVGLYPNPTIGYAAEEIGDEGTAGKQGGFIGQEIVTGGKLRLNRAIADQQVRQAEAALQAQRYRVLSAVRGRYYEVLSAQRTLQLAEDLLSVFQQGLKAARGLFEGGAGTRPDVLQASVEVQKAEIALENAQARYYAAWRQLADVLGTPELAPAEVTGSLDESVPSFQWDQLWQQISSQSPELRIAQADVERARAALRRAQVEPIPNILTRASVQSDRATGDTVVGVEVGIDLPLFNRNQGNIQAAFAQLRRAEQEVRRVELLLRDRLAESYAAYDAARKQVCRYRDSLLPAAQEALDLITEGYARGEFGFLEVLTAQRTYFEAHLAYLDSLRRVWQAVVELRGLLLTDGLSAP